MVYLQTGYQGGIYGGGGRALGCTRVGIYLILGSRGGRRASPTVKRVVVGGPGGMPNMKRVVVGGPGGMPNSETGRGERLIPSPTVKRVGREVYPAQQ